MSKNNLFYLSFLLWILASCSKERSSLQFVTPEFMTNDQDKLSNSIFFIGPELDSAKAEIIADCDCCASHLAFVDDSSFIYEVFCLGGDSYIKGDYVLFGDMLIIRTNKEIVDEEYEVGSMEEDFPITYEVVQQEPRYLSYKVSVLKGKQVIVYSKDDYTEYGIRDSGSVKKFLEELRKEKVLREYLTEI